MRPGTRRDQGYKLSEYQAPETNCFPNEVWYTPASSLLHRNSLEGLWVPDGVEATGSGGGGGHSIAAWRRAQGGQPVGRWSSVEWPTTTVLFETPYFYTSRQLPGSTTEYCQTQSMSSFTYRQSITVCSIDPRFAFNTQDEHTEAPLTKVFCIWTVKG